MSEPLVAIVILNTNRRDDTIACLESLAQSTYTNLHVFLLDNASTDGSVEAVCAQFPAVEIVSLTDNRGYAGNNNVGIQLAMERGADWVLVLNEDTIVDPDCIGRMVAEGERNPAIGMIGPLVYHHDEPTVIQSAGVTLGRFMRSSHIGQNEPDHGQFSKPQAVDCISGCAICVRREVIEAVGMLDERYFYYWEETEWCLRSRHAGWLNVVEPAAKLWHKGVQRDYQPKPSVAYYNTRNRLLTLSKQSVAADVWVVVYGEILRTLVSMSVRPKWRDKREHRDALYAGLRDFHRQRWGKAQL